MQVSSSNSSCERVARSGPRRMSSRSDTPRCFPQSSDGNRPRRLTRVTGLTLPRMSFWSGRLVLVTGGGGFLGRSLVEALARREPAKILAPRASELDLRERDDVRAYLAHEKPALIVHLAAVVGGIGANSAHPGLFFHTPSVARAIPRKLTVPSVDATAMRAQSGLPLRSIFVRKAWLKPPLYGRVATGAAITLSPNMEKVSKLPLT